MGKSLIDFDEWLKPHEETINQRNKYISSKIKKILGDVAIDDFALGYLYFGLQKTSDGWTFREWAPNATKIYLVGDFNSWQEKDEFKLEKKTHGKWEINLPEKAIKHGDKFKLSLHWDGGHGFRIPSYAKYVVQDEKTVDFSAVVWNPPTKYHWKHESPKPPKVPLIYESHVGMSSEEEKVATFAKFTKNVLPRIKKSGYNTVQIMAIPEHPYYGSFGYHVTNFFAVSSRFGTPDEFKKLVDTAHKLGLRVILDLVHSHAAKNEAEGLSRFDGRLDQYFYPGERGNHPAWDSRVFDYGKPEVLHFLLSNCRWWLDEYNIDGFRFDGVTSMLYSHHGLEKAFTSYEDYYKDDVEKDSLVYLTMANDLIHKVNPDATTIAEEMSGLPGVAAPTDSGGLGFDYRLAMGAPDLWIKTLKEKKDEDWDLGEILHTLYSHRPEEKVINYAESHDQALVGDKTLIFRLLDKDMYWHMQKSDTKHNVERGIALHKMIRLLTVATNGGGYLNFMGNEFGHPEWIDFPREGNSWSYKYARRQWSLAEDDNLRYQDLWRFDKELMKIALKILDPNLHYVEVNQADGTISFMRNDMMFLFNFSPNRSHADYQIHAPAGSYKILLSSDDEAFGGHGRIDKKTRHFTHPSGDQHSLSVYLPARTGIILQKVD